MTEAYKLAPAWLQCEGKEQYATASLATKVLTRRMASKRRRHKAPVRPMQVYRCIHCRAFHIGGK